MPLMFQVAAGVVLGGITLWSISAGLRHKEHRFAAVFGFLMTAALFIAAFAEKPASVGCGSNDPLCIRANE